MKRLDSPMRIPETGNENARPLPDRVAPGSGPQQVRGWEMIEAGRYMPRRFKGSFPGRELG